MKYTIEGFSQEGLMKLGLDVVDAVILRWLVDFAATGRMETRPHGHALAYKVRPTYIIKQMPCLGLKSRQSAHKRLDKLCDADVLEKRAEGQVVFFAFGKSYEGLVFKPSTPVDGLASEEAQKQETVNLSLRHRQPQLTDSSITDESIKKKEKRAPRALKVFDADDYRKKLREAVEKAEASGDLPTVIVKGLEALNDHPFGSYPKEWTAAKQLASKISTVCNGQAPIDFFRNLTRAYLAKRKSSKQEFWKEAPISPSAINCRFDQVLGFVHKKVEEEEGTQAIREMLANRRKA